MKKTLLTLAVLACFALTASHLTAQNAEDAKFKKFQDTFWDAYFKFFPTYGTLQGYAKYNEKLEDLSEASITKFLDGIDAFNQELVSKMDVTKISPELKVEVDMFRDFMDLTVMRLENSLFIVDNPLYYNGLFVDSLRSLMVRTPTAPALTARAKALPGLIKKAKDNLKTPPPEYTQAAIAQMPAVIDFFKIEVPKTAGAAPGLQAELVKVVTALEDYQRFLQGELLGKSTGNFRTGEAHLKALRYATQGNLSIQADVVARSTADANNIRRDMFLVCIPFYKIMYPNVDIEQMGRTKGEEQTRRTIIQGVLDKIKTDHIGRDEFVPRIATAAANIKAFIQQTKLIDLPEENLPVEPMPAYMFSGLWSLLKEPGAYDATGPYTLYLRPIPADWPEAQVTSFLEEHNNFYMDFMAVQKIYPGSFVPAFFTHKDPSVIKRVAANQALLRGWPVYVEEMLVEAGYGSFDLRMRLNQLKLMLKNVIDFQMDMNVHEGTWQKEKVMDYMMNGGFMTQAEAERRWNQIVLNPGDASLAYIGYQEILDMEKDYAKAKGQAFSAKEFLQKIVSFGAIPPRDLKAKLAQ